jgi:hypothetical protein
VTVLSAAKSAAIRLSQTQPTSLFSNPATFDAEMADLANETATAIAKAHDWQALTRLATLTGNASAIAFDLPGDYDRMLIKAKVHSLKFRTATFTPARDLDDWLYLNDFLVTGTPGNWVILGGQMQIFPAMAASETARFYYVSNQIVSGNKTAFVADTDAFVLPERLLTLGLIWRWRSQKRVEYAEDMSNYETALSEEINRDKGSHVITVGRQRSAAGVPMAWPGQINA